MTAPNELEEGEIWDSGVALRPAQVLDEGNSADPEEPISAEITKVASGVAVVDSSHIEAAIEQEIRYRASTQRNERRLKFLNRRLDQLEQSNWLVNGKKRKRNATTEKELEDVKLEIKKIHEGVPQDDEWLPLESEVFSSVSCDEDQQLQIPLSMNKEDKIAYPSTLTVDDFDDELYLNRIKAWAEDVIDVTDFSLGDRPDLSRVEITHKLVTETLQKIAKEETEEGLFFTQEIYSSLFPHQKDAINFFWRLHQQETGGILADDMGLGKTIQVISFLAGLHTTEAMGGAMNEVMGRESSNKPASCSLIICPATITHQWLAECHKWYPPFRCFILLGKTKQERQIIAKKCNCWGSILIGSYDTVRLDIKTLKRYSWHYLVLDEGQKIRNPDTAITLAVKQIHTKHRLLLSGSPIQNDLGELWSLIDFTCPGILGSHESFNEYFAEPIRQGGLMNASRAAALTAFNAASALRAIILPHFLRRNKKDVNLNLKLPPKTEQVLFCNLSPTQYLVYTDFIESLDFSSLNRRSNEYKMKPGGRRNKGSSSSSFQIFFALSVLRKLCNHPDLVLIKQGQSDAINDLGDLSRSGKMEVALKVLKLWAKEGHRTLLFSQTVQVLNLLEPHLKEAQIGYRRIDGLCSMINRRRVLEEFNLNKLPIKPYPFMSMADCRSFQSIPLLLLTSKVGGVGLNLTAANRIIIFDPDWNPMTDVQARERSWRIGQRKEVLIYRLMTAGTIEEKIYQRQIFKQFLSRRVLEDPRQKRFFKWNDLKELFQLPPRPDDSLLNEVSKRYRQLLSRSFSELSKNEEEKFACITDKAQLEQQLIGELPSTVFQEKDPRSGIESEQIAPSQLAELSCVKIPRRQKKTETDTDKFTKSDRQKLKGNRRNKQGELAETQVAGLGRLGPMVEPTVSQSTKEEKNKIIETLLDSGGIQSALSHDFYEMSHPDFDLDVKNSIERTARALEAIKAKGKQSLYTPPNDENSTDEDEPFQLSRPSAKSESVLQLLRRRADTSTAHQQPVAHSTDLDVWSEDIKSRLLELFTSRPDRDAFSTDEIIEQFNFLIGNRKAKQIRFKQILKEVCYLHSDRFWRMKDVS